MKQLPKKLERTLDRVLERIAKEQMVMADRETDYLGTLAKLSGRYDIESQIRKYNEMVVNRGYKN